MPPKSHKRPKATFMWHVRDWFERLFERIGKWLGNAAESFEWVIAKLGSLLLPWNWFRKASNSGVEEYSRDAGRRGWAESFEFFFQRLLGIVGFFFAPWRWFRHRDSTSEATRELTRAQSGSISETSEWIVGTFFEKVGESLRLLGQILFPKQVVEQTEKVQRSLTRSTLKTSQRIERWFASFAERFLPRQVFWPLYWIGRKCVDAFDFASEWWWSREYVKLTWAAPSLLLLVPISASVVLGYWNNDSRKIDHYRHELVKAQEANQHERTALLKRRLEQLGYQRLDLVEFKAALELAETKQFYEAYEKIKPFASVESPGLLQGHLWIASQLLHGNLVLQNEDGTAKDLWGEFEVHVDHALSQEPRNVWALRYRTELLLHQERWLEAIEQMESLVGEFPDFHATLAHAHNRVGNAPKSRLHAKRAIAYFDRIAAANASKSASASTVESGSQAEQEFADTSTESAVSEISSSELLSGKGDVPLSPLGFLRMAQVFSLVGEGDKELEILAKGVLVFPNHDEIREQYDNARLTRLRQYEFADPRMLSLMISICRESPEDEEVVRTLVRGLLANENPQGLARVGIWKSAIVDRDHQKAAKAAEGILQHLAEENLLSSKVYLRLGNYYLVSDNYKLAAQYYQKCCKLNPDSGDAWNNLAWLLADETVNDTENALRASNRAIAIRLDPRYLETRGQIYVKLKRWQAASEDLEVAISGGILNGNKARESLAACYSALGFEEQAEAHRRMISRASASSK